MGECATVVIVIDKPKPKNINGRTSRFIVDGKNLTEARIAANLSMDDVAGMLGGCNRSSVSRWEQGTLVPSEERILKLAEIFQTMGFVLGNPNYQKPGATNSKLTLEKAQEIRRRAADGESKTAIAKDFGVIRWTIWAICAGKLWKEKEFKTEDQK